MKTNVKYTEREEYIISLYKELIKEKDNEIKRLQAIIEHNNKLDEQKILSWSKDAIIFRTLKHFGK